MAITTTDVIIISSSRIVVVISVAILLQLILSLLLLTATAVEGTSGRVSLFAASAIASSVSSRPQEYDFLDVSSSVSLATSVTFFWLDPVVLLSLLPRLFLARKTLRMTSVWANNVLIIISIIR